MNDWKKFYEESLYPFQDGVLNCVKKLPVQFFLTGGTALSRGYFNHRYSDDLDFFLDNALDFKKQADAVMSAFGKSGFQIIPDNLLINESFISLFLKSDSHPGAKLKIDFVNDTAKRFGAISETGIYYRTDNWSNILSNKLCAMLRLEIKDYADIWIISKNKKFNWDRILSEAREKELGLDPILLAELLKSIPEEKFDSIKWTSSRSWTDFRSDMDQLVLDLLHGDDNSLCKI